MMFSSNPVSKSLLDAVNSVVSEEKEEKCVTKPEVKKVAKGEVEKHEKEMHKEETKQVEEGLGDTVKKVVKKAAEILGGPDDEGHKKDLQRKMGAKPEQQHGKKSMAKYNEETESTFKDRLLERAMTPKESKKKEEIVLSMKKNKAYFQKKYGSRWKEVMYATATKQAMGEELEFDDEQQLQEQPNVSTDMLSGRTEGGKLNSFRNFKVKIEGPLKTAHEPELEKAPDSKAKESIKAHGGGVNPIAQPRIGVDGQSEVNFNKEEVEQIDELSIDTLKRYHVAAHADASKVHNKTDAWSPPDEMKAVMAHVTKRMRGRSKAGRMITTKGGTPPGVKEDVEQVEEGWDDMLADVKKRNAPQPNGGSGKKQGTAYGGSKQKDKPEQDEKKVSEGKDPNIDAGVGSAPNFVSPENTTSSPVMKRVKEMAKGAMTRVKSEMLGKAPGNQ